MLSHFLNLPPPKNPTCKSIPLSKTSCHDSKSFSKPPPPKPYMQEYVSTSQLHLSKPSCHESKSFLKPPPPKPYMQEYVSTSQLHLSKLSCHESKSCLGRRQQLRLDRSTSPKKKSTRIAVDSFETIVSIEHVRFGCPHRHVILQITWFYRITVFGYWINVS